MLTLNYYERLAVVTPIAFHDSNFFVLTHRYESDVSGIPWTLRWRFMQFISFCRNDELFPAFIHSTKFLEKILCFLEKKTCHNMHANLVSKRDSRIFSLSLKKKNNTYDMLEAHFDRNPIFSLVIYLFKFWKIKTKCC